MIGLTRKVVTVEEADSRAKILISFMVPGMQIEAR